MTTGIDLVYIPLFHTSLNEGGSFFLNKIFTHTEQKIQKTESLAGIWAAKEAFFKATGSNLKPNQIEVNYEKSGRPKLLLPPEFIQMYPVLDISISHDHDYAVAICIAKHV